MSDTTTDMTEQERADFDAWRARQGTADPSTAIDPVEPTPVDVVDEEAVEPLYSETMNGKPRFLVIEANLHVQLSDGTEAVLRLDPPSKVFREVMKDQSDQEDLDQLFAMLRLLGQSDVVDRLEELGILELMGIVTRYFGEFQKKVRAETGESSRSSRS